MTRAEARGALRRMTLLCGGREQSALIIHNWDSSIPLRHLLNILTCPHLYSPHLFSTILSSPHPSSPHLSSSIFSSHFLIHLFLTCPHPSSPHLSSSIFSSPFLIHFSLLLSSSIFSSLLSFSCCIQTSSNIKSISGAITRETFFEALDIDPDEGDGDRPRKVCVQLILVIRAA